MKKIRKQWEYDSARHSWKKASCPPIYFFSPGLLFSFEQGKMAWSGFETSIMLFPINKGLDFFDAKTRWLGVGAFLQGHIKTDAPAGRLALGAQASYSVLGVELGMALRGGHHGQATVAAAHLAGFLSVGFLSLALRLDKPLAALGDGVTPENEVGFILGIKLPIFTNTIYHGTGVRGRPLEIARDVRCAALRQIDGWG